MNGKDFVFLYKTKLMFTFFKLDSLAIIAFESNDINSKQIYNLIHSYKFTPIIYKSLRNFPLFTSIQAILSIVEFSYYWILSQIIIYDKDYRISILQTQNTSGKNKGIEFGYSQNKFYKN